VTLRHKTLQNFYAYSATPGENDAAPPAFGRVCPLTPYKTQHYFQPMANNSYLNDYDAILQTLQIYVEGCKRGSGEVMRPAFAPDASFFGYAGGQLAVGTKFLFDWVDGNGPSPNFQSRAVHVDILQSIAVVRLEVTGLSGKLAGSDVSMSDLFTLLKTPQGWKIIQKAFHWHQ
jgi:hypothetical protein